MRRRLANLRYGDIAHMAARRFVGRTIGIADEIALNGRSVARPVLPRADALKTADWQSARSGETLREGSVGGLTQIFARHPDEATARARDDVAVAVIIIADLDAAITVAIIMREAKRIFVRLLLPDAAAGGFSDDRVA
ncbi:MAG: hypothetical protein JOY90_02845 [Bradyrhizobium sp.]|uniref:hypothetical protein n=1 Tax=Bradyrhizobium sp. TaxID=376 RepID=UPI001DB9D4CE|nr:hypothetical protein [Bradyrhizobium sp.]MBV9559390.1 hypothetical protein [Bradyrhizobium sp.]